MTVNGDTIDYEYNALDQLTNIGSVVYDYDERGNLGTITNGSNITNYIYDAADRLISATATYSYDADGRRVTQTFNGRVTNSLWDETSAYGDVVLETNGSGSTLASYVLGGTQLISQTRSGTTSYFLQDGQGSTRALTSSTTGAVTDSYSYTAFGEIFSRTGTTTNPYQYTGQQYDSLTGLYSLRARYYNPTLGRFLSQDTYPFDLSDPIESNRYIYTANNPVNAMDPSGHLLVEYAWQTAKTGAVIGALYGVGSTLFCGGNLAGNVLLGALSGFGLGFAFGLGMTYYPLTTLGLGTALSAKGVKDSIQDAIVNGPSSYACNGFNAAVSLLGVVLSGWGLVKGSQGYISSALRWLELNIKAPADYYVGPAGGNSTNVLTRQQWEL